MKGVAVLAVFTVLTAGCASDPPSGYSASPVVSNPRTVTQLRVQSMAHWEMLAGRLVEGLRPHLPGDASLPVRIDVSKPSPFTDSLAVMMTTRLASNGLSVDARAPQAVTIVLSARTLRFGGRRWTDAEYEARKTGAVSGRLPLYETLVTASIAPAGRLRMQVQEIVFVRQEDAALYDTGEGGRLIEVLRAHEERRLRGEPRRLSDSLAEPAYSY